MSFAEDESEVPTAEVSAPAVAGAGSTRLLRTEIGFTILRVQLSTVELLVYLLETIEKNADNGHFR